MRLFLGEDRGDEVRGLLASWPTKQMKKPKLGVQVLDTVVCRRKAPYGPVMSPAARHPWSFLLYWAPLIQMNNSCTPECEFLNYTLPPWGDTLGGGSRWSHGWKGAVRMRGGSQELWASASTILVLVELQCNSPGKRRPHGASRDSLMSSPIPSAICRAYLRFPQKFWGQLGTAAHRCKPSTWEVGIKGSWFQGQPTWDRSS